MGWVPVAASPSEGTPRGGDRPTAEAPNELDGLEVRRGVAGLERDSDVLIGQLIAVSNESFKRELGVIPSVLMRDLERRVRILLEL